MAVSVIDSSASVTSLVDNLEDQPIDPPSLYLDVEGIALSRYGSISIIQIFLLPTNHVYLIDVFVLQQAAFDTASRSGTTLRAILESALIPKVFFDVRNDADALYALFNIKLQDVHDIQLLEVATRSWPRDRLLGLQGCIVNDGQLSAEAQKRWKATKERGQALFTNQGGSYEAFNIRPIPDNIINYCSGDVVHLPGLWKMYSQKIGTSWLKRVQEETRRRVAMSQDESYNPLGKDKTLSPWAKKTKVGKDDSCGRNKAGRAEEMMGFGTKNTASPKKPTPGEISAAKAFQRQAEKRLGNKSIDRSSAENAERDCPRHGAGYKGAKKPTAVAKTLLESRSVRQDLPTRAKVASRGNATTKANTERPSYTTNLMWTCTTCSRKMLHSQQEDHLGGQAHKRLAKLQRAAADVSCSAMTNITTPPKETSTATTKSQKAKAKSAPKTQQENPGKGKPKSTKRRNGAASAPNYLYAEDHPYSDYGLVGFGQNWSATSASDKFCVGSGYDWGLCDKNCGWCGHCMDNVDL
ncbi:MAG: hypothetical protein Q9167_007842 [Letrouitia subvulpina]